MVTRHFKTPAHTTMPIRATIPTRTTMPTHTKKPIRAMTPIRTTMPIHATTMALHMSSAFLMKLAFNMIMIFSIIWMTSPCRSETFTVSTTAEFVTALNTAQNNDADDIIYVQPGHYGVTETLSYRATYNEGRKSLTISGIKGSTGFPRLDGLSARQIMNIDTFSSSNDYYIDVIIENLVFQNGRDTNYGAGLYIRGNYAAFTVKRCYFYNNSCYYEGGGLSFLSLTPLTIQNCIFNQNHAQGQGASSRGGGARIRYYSDIGICSNNTFLNNTAEGSGDHVYFSVSNDSVTNVYDNIFWGADAEVSGYLYDTALLNFYNNDYQIANFPGSGTFTSVDSITADPLLDEFFVPTMLSPVIDSGLTFHGMPTTDYLGSSRPNPNTGLVDIGAVEYYGDLPTATPGTSPTATPTVGPTPASGVSIDMPTLVFPSDNFWVTGHLHNAGPMISGIPVFFILDIYGDYWFWPCWDHYTSSDPSSICYEIWDVPTGTTPVTVLPTFIWPDVDSEMNGLYFYGAMLQADLSGIIGEMATREWGFGL